MNFAGWRTWALASAAKGNAAGTKIPFGGFYWLTQQLFRYLPDLPGDCMACTSGHHVALVEHLHVAYLVVHLGAFLESSFVAVVERTGGVAVDSRTAVVGLIADSDQRPLHRYPRQAGSVPVKEGRI